MDEDVKARELAYADNRVSQLSLDFDPDVIARDLESGLDLSDWFRDFEINDILESAGDSIIDNSPLDFDDVSNAEGKHQCPNCGHEWKD